MLEVLLKEEILLGIVKKYIFSDTLVNENFIEVPRQLINESK